VFTDRVFFDWCNSTQQRAKKNTLRRHTGTEQYASNMAAFINADKMHIYQQKLVDENK